jgi:hypothetical protein
MGSWIDMDRYFLRTFSSGERRQRSFHRLGIAIAGAIIAVGLAFVGTAMVRLAMVAGFTLVLLGAVAIASYGVVRAIERASRNR